MEIPEKDTKGYVDIMILILSPEYAADCSKLGYNKYSN